MATRKSSNKFKFGDLLVSSIHKDCIYLVVRRDDYSDKSTECALVVFKKTQPSGDVPFIPLLCNIQPNAGDYKNTWINLKTLPEEGFTVVGNIASSMQKLNDILNDKNVS